MQRTTTAWRRTAATMAYHYKPTRTTAAAATDYRWPATDYRWQRNTNHRNNNNHINSNNNPPYQEPYYNYPYHDQHYSSYSATNYGSQNHYQNHLHQNDYQNHVHQTPFQQQNNYPQQRNPLSQHGHTAEYNPPYSQFRNAQNQRRYYVASQQNQQRQHNRELDRGQPEEDDESDEVTAHYVDGASNREEHEAILRSSEWWFEHQPKNAYSRTYNGHRAGSDVPRESLPQRSTRNTRTSTGGSGSRHVATAQGSASPALKNLSSNLVPLPLLPLKTKRTAPTPEYLARASLDPVTETVEERSRKQLCILDLNGTLIFRGLKGRKSRKNPASWYVRPGAEEFLEYLFENFEVMVWSSAQQSNVEMMVGRAFPPHLVSRLLAIWDRRSFHLSDQQFQQKTLTLKNLDIVWDEFRRNRNVAPYGQADTVLIDDSDLKSKCQPYNCIVVTEFGADNFRSGDCDELTHARRYLDALRTQKDISAYMRHFPYRQS